MHLTLQPISNVNSIIIIIMCTFRYSSSSFQTCICTVNTSTKWIFQVKNPEANKKKIVYIFNHHDSNILISTISMSVTSSCHCACNATWPPFSLFLHHVFMKLHYSNVANRTKATFVAYLIYIQIQDITIMNHSHSSKFENMELS